MHALDGLLVLIRREPNAQIQMSLGFISLLLGWVFRINTVEWIAVLFCIALVISLEGINSALETLSDFVTPEKHELIKKTKDLAAGAVLWASMISLIIGLIIFLPKIMALISAL